MTRAQFAALKDGDLVEARTGRLYRIKKTAKGVFAKPMERYIKRINASNIYNWYPIEKQVHNGTGNSSNHEKTSLCNW